MAPPALTIFFGALNLLGNGLTVMEHSEKWWKAYQDRYCPLLSCYPIVEWVIC
jgi:hypothetical protein